MTAEEYERIALIDPSVKWELHRGRLREKPGMTWNQAEVIAELLTRLYGQVNRNEYRVHVHNGRLRRAPKN